MVQPSQDDLSATLARYERVAQDPRYRALSQRGEFRTTHELLKRYEPSRAPQPDGLPDLPPPPMQ